MKSSEIEQAWRKFDPVAVHALAVGAQSHRRARDRAACRRGAAVRRPYINTDSALI
jgi:hypothetical protein